MDKASVTVSQSSGPGDFSVAHSEVRCGAPESGLPIPAAAHSPQRSRGASQGFLSLRFSECRYTVIKKFFLMLADT